MPTREEMIPPPYLQARGVPADAVPVRSQSGGPTRWLHKATNTVYGFTPDGKLQASRWAEPKPSQPVSVPAGPNLTREPVTYEDFCAQMAVRAMRVQLGLEQPPVHVVTQYGPEGADHPSVVSELQAIAEWSQSPEYAEQVARSDAIARQADRDLAPLLQARANSTNERIADEARIALRDMQRREELRQQRAERRSR